MNTWKKEYVLRLIHLCLKAHTHSLTYKNCCLMCFALRLCIIKVTFLQCLKKRSLVRRRETTCRYYRCAERSTNTMGNTTLQLSDCLEGEAWLAIMFLYRGDSVNLWVWVCGWQTETLNLYSDQYQLDFTTLSYTEHQNQKPFYPQSDEWITLETSTLKSLYGNSFTLLTQLTESNYLATDAALQFLWKLTPPPRLQSRPKVVGTLEPDHVSPIPPNQCWKISRFFQQKEKKSPDYQHFKWWEGRACSLSQPFCPGLQNNVTQQFRHNTTQVNSIVLFAHADWLARR